MSIEKYAKINVDLLEDFQTSELLNATFYSQDENSAVLEFQLNEGEKEVDISERKIKGILALKMTDGTLFVSEEFKVEGNKMSFILPSEYLSHPGQVSGEFFVSEGDKKISAVRFKFNIRLSLVDFPAPADESFVKTLRSFVEYYAGKNTEDLKDIQSQIEEFKRRIDDWTYEEAKEHGLGDWADEQIFKGAAEETRSKYNETIQDYIGYTEIERLFSFANAIKEASDEGLNISMLLKNGVLKETGGFAEGYNAWMTERTNDDDVFEGTLVEYTWLEHVKLVKHVAELETRLENMEGK